MIYYLTVQQGHTVFCNSLVNETCPRIHCLLLVKTTLYRLEEIAIKSIHSLPIQLVNN